MIGVGMVAPADPRAEYCLTDQARRDILTNLERYRAALESSLEAIRQYNSTVQKGE